MCRLHCLYRSRRRFCIVSPHLLQRGAHQVRLLHQRVAVKDGGEVARQVLAQRLRKVVVLQLKHRIQRLQDLQRRHDLGDDERA